MPALSADEKFSRQKTGCDVTSGEVSRIFTGSAFENTCVPTANSRSRALCRERVATQRPSERTIEAPQIGFDDCATKCSIGSMITHFDRSWSRNGYQSAVSARLHCHCRSVTSDGAVKRDGSSRVDLRTRSCIAAAELSARSLCEANRLRLTLHFLSSTCQQSAHCVRREPCSGKPHCR